MATLITFENVGKIYHTGDIIYEALHDVNLTIDEGEMVVILGPSGAGKSTLLNMLGGLDAATSGRIIFGEKEVTALNDKELGDFRAVDVGIIFQFYNLVPNLTVRENIQVCEYLTKDPINIDELMNVLGLTEHQHKFPSQLSGGQQQRCAIARALAKNPKVLLCDEPTGALDSKTSRDILVLLEKINRRYGTTMLIVTHNNSIKNMVDHVIYLKDGEIYKDYYNDKKIPASELEDL